MSTTFYVKVSGRPASRHRSAEGTYKVEVLETSDPRQDMVVDAMHIAANYIPFYQENAMGYSLSVFDEAGCEVYARSPVGLHGFDNGCFCGRAESLPSHLTH